jgi:hypothetical protein
MDGTLQVGSMVCRVGKYGALRAPVTSDELWCVFSDRKLRIPMYSDQGEQAVQVRWCMMYFTPWSNIWQEYVREVEGYPLVAKILTTNQAYTKI